MDKPQRLKIPFRCPRCGEGGAVRVHKLDRSIRCKVCEAVFHLNRRFEVVVGSPTIDVPHVPQRAASSFRGDLVPRWVRITRRRITPFRAGVGAAATLCIALVGWLYWSGPSTHDLPTTLSGRVKLFATHWVENDIRQIRRVTDPKFAGFVDEWWKLSKKAFKAIQRIEDIDYDVLFENRRQGSAASMISPRGVKGRNAELVLFWNLQPDGVWLFDPKRSLEDAGRWDTN